MQQENVKEYIYQDDHVAFFDRVLHYGLRKFTGGRPLTWRFPFTAKERERLIQKVKPAVVIIHEPENLPYFLKLRAKYKFKLVFNAHEYHPLEFEDRPEWQRTSGRYFFRLYKKYLHSLDLLINVCDGIAEECEKNFGIVSFVFPNAALYRPDIKPVPLSDGPIRMIQHGACIRERNIELMVKTAQLLGSDYRLDLMLMKNDKSYYEELIQLASKTSNVRLIEPVSFDEIVPFINQYDIGLYYIKPSSFNNRMALPNKLYEFIQARLCTVISPSVEMKRVVEQNSLGRVAVDFTAESMAEAVKGLSKEQIYDYKQKADASAYKLSAEFLSDKLLEKIVALL